MNLVFNGRQKDSEIIAFTYNVFVMKPVMKIFYRLSSRTRVEIFYFFFNKSSSSSSSSSSPSWNEITGNVWLRLIYFIFQFIYHSFATSRVFFINTQANFTSGCLWDLYSSRCSWISRSGEFLILNSLYVKRWQNFNVFKNYKYFNNVWTSFEINPSENDSPTWEKSMEALPKIYRRFRVISVFGVWSPELCSNRKRKININYLLIIINKSSVV